MAARLSAKTQKDTHRAIKQDEEAALPSPELRKDVKQHIRSTIGHYPLPMKSIL